MSYVVTLSPAIETDVLTAVEHYAAIDQTLAERFTHELERTLALIETYPLAGRLLYDDVRRMVLDRFPYLFTYRVDGEQVRVQLLVHARRDPVGIKRETEDR